MHGESCSRVVGLKDGGDIILIRRRHIFLLPQFMGRVCKSLTNAEAGGSWPLRSWQRVSNLIIGVPAESGEPLLLAEPEGVLELGRRCADGIVRC